MEGKHEPRHSAYRGCHFSINSSIELASDNVNGSVEDMRFRTINATIHGAGAGSPVWPCLNAAQTAITFGAKMGLRLYICGPLLQATSYPPQSRTEVTPVALKSFIASSPPGA